MDFIGAYSNLLHYAGVAHGVVAEDMPMKDFLDGGPDLLVKCRVALFNDLDLLDEFAEDTQGKNPEMFTPMLQAVEHMRPILACVLRDTDEHTVCFDIGENAFYHVKSLTEPLAAKVGKEYGVARMVLMTYAGQVIHDGLVIGETAAPGFTAAQKRELEAEYEKTVAQGQVMGPWGPGSGRIMVEELSEEAFNATVGTAILFNPFFATVFVTVADQSTDENTYLELCLDLMNVIRNDPDKDQRAIFGDEGLADHDLFLFTLDRIEGDVRALLRKPLKARAKRQQPKANKRKQRPAEPKRTPVTLAERLHAAAPFKATGTRELTQVMRERGTPITLKTVLTITHVYEGPDEIGIACALGSLDTEAQVVAPLTYLVLPPSSPFAREVEEWRRKRHRLIAKLNAGY